MNKLLTAFAGLTTLLLLIACQDEAVETPAPVATTPVAATVNDTAYTEFNVTPTIRDVMNTLVDPNADALWNAVLFVVDETGEHDYRPETEEEWEALRKNAIAIVEGGNSLMIPGRLVAPPGSTTEFPEYEFMPAEVEEILRQDRLPWIGFAQGLQFAGLQMLEAVQARDADLLSEYGLALDEACEACHSHYWYRVN